jgi:hypothetical protein
MLIASPDGQWSINGATIRPPKAVVENFVDLGVPVRFRSDNGPQFEAQSFQVKLRQWGVVWENSTPNYPQSNGHAEAAVATMKDLMAKISPVGVASDEFSQGMLEFRNTPRENGLSSAEMIFGLSLHSIIPAHRTAYATNWQSVMEARERQVAIDASVKFRYDENARRLTPLSIGTNVRIRDPKSKFWDRVGVGVGDPGIDDSVPAEESSAPSHLHGGSAINTTPPPLRRGERVRKRTVMFDV